MKKVLIAAGVLVVISAIIAIAKSKVSVTTTSTFWADEGDPEFVKSSEIKKVLTEMLPGKTYILRYYLKHNEPSLVNSIYIEYTDPDFSKENTKKYADPETGTGEFAIIGHALCQNNQLKAELGYKAITLHVTSANSGTKEYLEKTWLCADAEKAAK